MLYQFAKHVFIVLQAGAPITGSRSKVLPPQHVPLKDDPDQVDDIPRDRPPLDFARWLAMGRHSPAQTEIGNRAKDKGEPQPLDTCSALNGKMWAAQQASNFGDNL